MPNTIKLSVKICLTMPSYSSFVMSKQFISLKKTSMNTKLNDVILEEQQKICSVCIILNLHNIQSKFPLIQKIWLLIKAQSFS